MVNRGRRPPPVPQTSGRPRAHAEEGSDTGDVVWSDTSASTTPAHGRRTSRSEPGAADDAESDSTDLSGFIVDDGASDDKLDGDDDSDDDSLADRGCAVRPATSAALADRLFNDGPAAAAPPAAPRRRLVRRAESGV